MPTALRPNILTTHIIHTATTLLFTAAFAFSPVARAQESETPAKKSVTKKAAEPAKVTEPSTPAAPAEKPADGDVALWLGGVEPKGDALKALAQSASWKMHAKGLEAAWEQS